VHCRDFTRGHDKIALCLHKQARGRLRVVGYRCIGCESWEGRQIAVPLVVAPSLLATADEVVEWRKSCALNLLSVVPESGTELPNWNVRCSNRPIRVERFQANTSEIARGLSI
jgi:hypothetical protein